MKNELQIPQFENLCCDWTDTRYSKRIKAAAKFCAERHSIYIKRRAGEAGPWTKDPILRGYRFCNVYREVDRITVEIMNEWVKPNIGSDNVALVTLLGRVINFPSTLIALREAGVDFHNFHRGERAWKVFTKILTDADKSKRQLVTGAYIVNTVFPRDFPKKTGSKADYIANFFIPEMWSHREDLKSALATNSFATMLDAYKKVHGVGSFIANQAAVDLTYTRFLSKAKDINDVWSPGPGTQKGIRRIVNDYDLNPGEAMNQALTKYSEDLNHELSGHKLWSSNVKDVHTHIVPLTNPNASNSLCEVSKHFGMAMGERERLKNTYKPQRT